ncbi:unnamed protein product [Neospora caninum Liverpool]|uniref:Rhoptry protein 4 n=2 Tax=Neospora caninum TaxID=29176 RepID=F0V7L8_NEOCL|nr:uncharacterized protein NCLIV_001970 [Neospora caninum Liverpool]ADM48813.1 ROP2 family member 1 [Neospora caninum]CBZ49709.1 unnamed protein product [Neospora caninum Liverpool]CEL64294.1 TPA: Rhoptry protein 4 [Neospora caninum Liverpool]|eukprot:XP_003879744.1 uncharacterized protein NCLIV_001970 [Neospora caninum Liverpool]
MEQSASVGPSSCLVRLAGALLVLALCHAQRGAGILLPQSWDDSEAALSVSPVGGLMGEHRTASAEQANFVAEEQVEDKRGGSWLQQEEVEQVPSEAQNQTDAEPGTQSSTRFGRLLARLRWRGRGRGGSAGAAQEQQRRRVPLRTRLLQHLKRGVRFLRHDIPAAAARLYRRLRPGQPRLFPVDEVPSDVETNPMYYHGRDSGDVILEELFKRIPEAGQPIIYREASAYDDLVSRMLWRNQKHFSVVSELGEPSRTLIRGRMLGKGPSAIVFEATDRETGETLAVSVPYFTEKPSAMDIEGLRDEVLCINLFPNIKNPKQAQTYMRLLVPTDIVRARLTRLSRRGLVGQSRIWIVNRYFLYPLMQTNLISLIEGLSRSSDVNSNLAIHARLQLTVQVIKLAASLHHHGVVHGNLQMSSIFIQKNGAVFLGKLRYMVKEGEYSEFTFGRGFEPPETTDPSRQGRSYDPRKHKRYAFDAWAVGLAIHWIWCEDLPDTESAPLGGTEWIFKRCRNIELSEPVKFLLEGFLRHDPEDRLLPLQATETPQFENIKEMISSVLNQYDQQGEPKLWGKGDLPTSGTTQGDDGVDETEDTRL